MWVIGAALWLQLLPALGCYLLKSAQLRSHAAVLEFFAPIAAALAWNGMRRDYSEEQVAGKDSSGNSAIAAIVDGTSAAVTHYNITAGIGIMLWALGLVHLINEGPTLGLTLARMLREPASSAGSAANAILSADAVGLWVALLGFAAAEDGFVVAAWVAAGSALVGPGAAVALYLGNVRERRIGSATIRKLRKLE